MSECRARTATSGGRHVTHTAREGMVSNLAKHNFGREQAKPQTRSRFESGEQHFF